MIGFQRKKGAVISF